MPNEGHAALSASKETVHKFLNLFVDYLLPIGTFFVGLFEGYQLWGGINAVYDATHAFGNTSGSVELMLSAALFGGIFGVTGYAFWGLGSGGTIGKVIGRGFGGYFFGAALSYLMPVLQPAGVPDGLIDNLIAGLRGL